MTIENDPIVRQYVRLIHGQGDYCDFGCSKNDVEAMIARAKELFPRKPYCVASGWTWADIEIDPRQADEVAQAGVHPAFIYADNILSDEADRWAQGSCVRTTLLVAFHENCIFSTRNTSYILVGSGTRLKVAPAVYNGIYF
ncbi:MAG: hypothetical protein WEB57_00675 [Pseudohongiellaceae bacterium]